jgi:hypothetical protein
MKGLMTAAIDCQFRELFLRSTCYSECDYRNLNQMRNISNNNLTSSARVFAENKYAEFTTLFRIAFKQGEVPRNPNAWKDLLASWTPVCILALEMRMDSYVSMLFRNRDNVIYADEQRVVFKKNNGQIHSFNHSSFVAMQEIVEQFKHGDWGTISRNSIGVRQLLKALYWIPDSERADHGGFGFGQLISCLEEFAIY